MGVRRAAAALIATVVTVAGLVIVPAAGAATGPDPFAGNGTWVSIFAGESVWDHPVRHVRQMHQGGVRTLFLQTASSTNPVGSDVYRPGQVARFLHAAHARGMSVVAWYLPPLRRVEREHQRAMAAIRFRTWRGQRFDAFALDIEPSATTPGGTVRNRKLWRLSRKLRGSVGDGYRLGAIVPSARGLAASPRFWPDFPYRTVRRHYDVVLPMSYHTYRVTGPSATYSYTLDNVTALRAALGPDMPVHVIGGEAGPSSRRETRAFVQACRDAGVLGASLWHYGGYGPEDWQEMQQLTVPAA